MAEHASIPIASIPLVVTLWEQPNFGGRIRKFIDAFLDPVGSLARIEDLTGCNFNDATNAIGIHPGPNFDPNEKRTVSFFEDANFQGDELCLGAGAYSDLVDWGDFGGKISSIAFNAPGKLPGLYRGGNLVVSFNDLMPPPAAQISPIPLVVRLFADSITALDDRTGYPLEAQANSNYLTLVESALDIGAIYGQEFDQATSAVVVQKGPNYVSSAHARLCVERLVPGDNGDAVEHLDVFPDQDTEPTQDPNTLIGIAQGVYPALGNLPYNFNDKTRAVLIISPEVTLVKPHPGFFP